MHLDSVDRDGQCTKKYTDIECLCGVGALGCLQFGRSDEAVDRLMVILIE